MAKLKNRKISTLGATYIEELSVAAAYLQLVRDQYRDQPDELARAEAAFREANKQLRQYVALVEHRDKVAQARVTNFLHLRKVI